MARTRRTRPARHPAGGKPAQAQKAGKATGATPASAPADAPATAFVGPGTGLPCAAERRRGGSLDGLQAKLEGTGSGLALNVLADLAPRTPLVLRSASARRACRTRPR